jgi:hypothetical protein
MRPRNVALASIPVESIGSYPATHMRLHSSEADHPELRGPGVQENPFLLSKLVAKHGQAAL